MTRKERFPDLDLLDELELDMEEDRDEWIEPSLAVLAQTLFFHVEPAIACLELTCQRLLKIDQL